jgi:hypothetical protein
MCAPQENTESATEDQEKKIEWYTVGGERHGVSYFRKEEFPEVEYAAGEQLTFDRYHTVEVINTWLKRWAEEYPGLIEVYEVARSFEDRPILQVTLTNREKGADTDKPAAYFEGGRHSGEVTATESVLWLLQYLLGKYGTDEEITRLIDTKAIYLRPVNNPDGSNLYLHTAQRNRSTLRPHDNDRDGLLDEDPPEDLDGDGIIYSLRWKARPEKDKGNYIIDPRDPTGRLMKRVPEGEGDWMVISEGIDSDGDGDFNEDGIGGLDLHRNYPENWRPDRDGDRTKRGYTQSGAGEFPLSESETRSVALWMLSHPNISVVNSMDTSVPMHLRPPSTSKGPERMFPEDLAYYQKFDRIGQDITGYPWAGDVYDVYMTRFPEDQVTGDPTRPSPLFGHGPDFGYFYLGAIWYGDELWNGGRHSDFNGDGLFDDLDALKWDDDENGGRGFREWEPFEHPALGAVEIGGFHPKFFSQNGPPEQLERWVSREAFFNLAMMKELPQLTLDQFKLNRLESAGDTREYEIEISWTNTGNLPVALKQAQLVKIVQEDRAQLEFDKKLLKKPNPAVSIVEPTAYDKTIQAGYTEPGQSQSVRFVVQVSGNESVEGKAKVLSTRGGYLEIPFTLVE